MESGSLLTTGEVAKLLEVTPDTVRFYERRGQLKAAVFVGRGHRLFRRSEVERFARQRGTAPRASGPPRIRVFASWCSRFWISAESSIRRTRAAELEVERELLTALTEAWAEALTPAVAIRAQEDA